MLQRIKAALSTGPQPAMGPTHPVHPGWQEFTRTVFLNSGESIRLRPLSYKDSHAWCEQRTIDRDLLEPVEPTVEQGWVKAHQQSAWRAYYLNLKNAADAGIVVPFVIEVDGEFAGQVTLGNIQHGIVSECWIGYWVFSDYQGKGVATVACALGADHAVGRVGLHRVTATYLPFNEASGKVLASNGFTEEGFLRKNLHINGSWQDHCLVALTRDDFDSTCVDRLVAAGKVRRGSRAVGGEQTSM